MDGQREWWWTGPAEEPNRYRIATADLDQVEHGGQGVVYRAERADTGEPVALKLLTRVSSAEFAAVEALTAALDGFDHPNVMRQREVFLGCGFHAQADGDDAELDFDVPYVVSNWVHGTPLVTATEQLDLVARLGVVVQLAGGLAALHRIRVELAPDGVMHRDLKPSNVRLDPDGRAVLLDFGVARPLAVGDMTQGVGTHRWRAPEVIDDGAIGTAADVWGLGALAHWMIIGDPPRLDGSEAARHRLVGSSLLASHPKGPWLAGHLARLLAYEPLDRPDDLDEWASQLARVVDGGSIPTPRRRRRLAFIAAATLIVGGVGGARYLPERGAREGAVAIEPTLATAETTTGTDGDPDPAEPARLAAIALQTLPANPALAVAVAAEAVAAAEPPDPAALDALVRARADLEASAAFPIGTPVSTDFYALAVREQANGDVIGVSPSKLGSWAVGTAPRIIEPDSAANDLWAVIDDQASRAVSIAEGGRVRVWNLADGRETTFDAAVAPNQGRTVSLESGGVLAIADQSTVRFWDVETGTPLAGSITAAERVTAVELAPSGQLIAVGLLDGAIGLWTVPRDGTGAQLRGLPVGPGIDDARQVDDLAFSADGRFVAAASDGAVRVFESASGVEVFGALEPAMLVALSPDGSLLALGNAVGEVSVWSIADLSAPLGDPAGDHDGPVSALAFNGDGTEILSSATDSRVIRRRVLTSRSSTGLSTQFTGIAIDDRGTTVAAATSSGTVELRDGSTLELLGTLPSVDPDVRSRSPVVFTGDDALVTIDNGNTLMRWDVGTPSSPRLLASAAITPGYYGLSASPSLIAYVDQLERVDLVDPVTLELIGVLPVAAEFTAEVSADGSTVAVVDADESAVHLFAASGEPLGTIPAAGVGAGVLIALNADGSVLATEALSNDGPSTGIELWDVGTGTRLAVLPAELSSGQFVRGSRDLLAASDMERGGTTIIDVSTGEPVTHWLRWLTSAPLGSPSPAGTDPELLVLDDYGLARVQLTTEREMARIPTAAIGFSVSSIDASADEQTIVLGDSSGSLDIWSPRSPSSLRRLRSVTLGAEAPLMSFEVSLDATGQRLAVSDSGAIEVWSPTEGVREDLGPIEEPLREGWPRVALSPDGTTLVTVSDRREIAVWDLVERTKRGVLGVPAGEDGYSDELGVADDDSPIAFAPDGRLAVRGADEVLSLWDVGTLEGESTAVRLAGSCWAMDPAMTTVAVCTESTVSIVDFDTGEVRREISVSILNDRPKSVAFDATGTVVFARWQAPESTPAVRLFDLATGRPVGEAFGFEVVRFLPESRSLIGMRVDPGQTGFRGSGITITDDANVAAACSAIDGLVTLEQIAAVIGNDRRPQACPT